MTAVRFHRSKRINGNVAYGATARVVMAYADPSEDADPQSP